MEDGTVLPGLLIQDEPEVRIGEASCLRGGGATVTYDRLLRVDGRLEGDVLSSGDIIVGECGTLVGDVREVRHLVVLGALVGRARARAAYLGARARLHGELVCGSLSTATSGASRSPIIIGSVRVEPGAFEDGAAQEVGRGCPSAGLPSARAHARLLHQHPKATSAAVCLRARARIICRVTACKRRGGSGRCDATVG